MLWNDWLSPLCRRSVRRPACGIRRDRGRRVERLEPRCLLAATGAIEGTKFLDVDSDGELDDGEPGLAGWTIFVDRNNNGQLDLTQATIESDEEVEIPDLGQGESTIEVSDLAGTIADVDVTLDISHTYIGDLQIVLVSPSGTRVLLVFQVGDDAGAFTDTTLDDEASLPISDGDVEPPFTGRFQPEQPLNLLDCESPNGTWTLEVADLAEIDEGIITRFQLTLSLSEGESEPFAVTDETGAYRIEDLAAGTFTVRELPQPGFVQTFPEEGAHVVTLGAGETESGVDFGNAELPGSIRGQVWNDLNGDGVHDSNEPGRNDMLIELLDANSLEVVASMQSTSIDLNGDEEIDPLTETGLYAFEELASGRYIVREELQDGITQTAPEADNSVVDDDPIVQAGTFEVTAPPTGTPEAPAPWLPDLIVNMEEEEGLRNAFLDGDTLRFGQATPNVGDGPMRLVGGPVNDDGTQTVFQRIFDDQGGFTERVAGNFIFHEEHNHIHFDGFARYALREVLSDDDGDGLPDVGDVVRGGAKVSFCLIDIQPFITNPPLPNAAEESSGFGCDTEQQISVGWEDIYSAGTEGQEINIAGLAPGDYWLEAIVDPDNHFIEKDETNNIGRILIHLGPAQRSFRVTLDPGESVERLDFGNFEPIDVTGSVFTDTNANGQRGPGERGREGIAAYIDLNGDHILNNPGSGDGVADGLAEEPWALTDENGNFVFEGLRSGSYQVRIVAPAGLLQTTETPARVEAASGQDVSVGSFGVGVILGATTRVTTDGEDGHVVVSDISALGQNDRLTVTVEGSFEEVPDLIPHIRIHDPNHTLTTTVGVQEGLHTVFIPITEFMESNLIEINGGNGNDRISVNLSAFPGMALLNGGAGNDTMTIAGESFSMSSEVKGEHDHTDEDLLNSIFDDEEEFFAAATVNGGEGNDQIVGRDYSPGLLLNGDGGNDSIVGGAGRDSIAGGDGNDKLSGGDGDDELFGGAGLDQLHGDRGTDTLQGDAGNDLLQGGTDDDLFRSGDGDGLDTVEGGAGFDTIHVDGAAINETYSVTTINSLRTKLQRTNGRPLAIEMTSSESLIVHGLAGNDRVTVGSGAASQIGVSFDGGAGDDTMQFNGSARNDYYLLADFNHYLVNVNIPRSVNVANVRAGTEHVLANLGAGDDEFLAGDVFAESIQITVRGEAGNDTITGGAGRDRLFGDNGNDALFGAAGDDFLAGGNGTDELQGSLGADTISGGADDDVLDGGDGDDLLNGDRGHDTLVGGEDNDALIGLDGNDRLEGNEGNDTLVGGVGNDQLFGDSGTDLLLGNDGDDRLDGGEDTDTLVGGNGRNRFIDPEVGEIVAVFRFNLQRLLDQF